MATARDIVKGAMQKLGVIRKGETPSADEAADGLESLKDMLSSWSNSTLLISARVRESFSLTSGVGEYTIGAGATFDTARPIALISAFVRQGTTDYQLDIIPDEDYATLISNKSIQGVPDRINLDNAYPISTIRLFTVPSSNDYDLHLYSEKEITDVTTLDSDADFPPGWKRALEWNLCLEIAPEYGVTPQPRAEVNAQQSLLDIKRAQIRSRPVTYLESLKFRYDISGDTYT